MDSQPDTPSVDGRVCTSTSNTSDGDVGGETATGHSVDRIERPDDGRLRLHGE